MAKIEGVTSVEATMLFYSVYEGETFLGRFENREDAEFSVKVTWSKLEVPNNVVIKEEKFSVYKTWTHF